MVEARFYVDAQCVKFEKSLLESGTMGTSGNVDPIVSPPNPTHPQHAAAAHHQTKTPKTRREGRRRSLP